MIDRQRQKRYVAAQYDGSTAATNYLGAMMDDSWVQGRFFNARCQVTQDALASCPGGDILDAGCGPESVATNVFESRPNDFRAVMLDQSPAMVERCAARLHNLCAAGGAVGELETLPFASERFDMSICIGALDYTEKSKAINELSRVTREGGLVVVSMLNVFNPNRLAQWTLWWPSLRLLGAIERLLGVPASQRHGSARSGIRPLPSGALRRLMRRANLEPIGMTYFDLRLPLPQPPPVGGPDALRPVMDYLSRLLHRLEQQLLPKLGENKAVRCVMGSAYCVVARRVHPLGTH